MSAYPISAPQDAGETGSSFGLARLIARLVDVVLAWQERARERDTLAQLDQRMLKDVGLTPADVVMELDKPFWER